MACLFCRIVAGEIPAAIVHRDEHIVAFRDVDPQAPTHILVIPVEHIAGADELEPRHGDILARMFVVAQQVAASDGVAATGYRLVFNVGRHASQSVPHLHLHVIGGRQLSWPPG